MASVAGGAFVFVPAHLFMAGIHARFGVCMAIDAFERAVIWLGRVAVAAAVPSPRRMIASCTDREEIVVREESRGLPVQRPVTLGAVR
jgi:hypothetical protein